MKPITGPAPSAIEADFWHELAQIEAESIGWHEIDERAYLHIGSDVLQVEITGQATANMAGSNVLWLV
jgi:Na+-transporting NADH:ubiquinone oxidoreductase subunit NqrA